MNFNIICFLSLISVSIFNACLINSEEKKVSNLPGSNNESSVQINGEDSIDSFVNLMDSISELPNNLKPWFFSVNQQWHVGPLKKIKLFKNGKFFEKRGYSRSGGLTDMIQFDETGRITYIWNVTWHEQFPLTSITKQIEYNNLSIDEQGDSAYLNIDTFETSEVYTKISDNYVIVYNDTGEIESSRKYVNEWEHEFVVQNGTVLSMQKSDSASGFWMGEVDQFGLDSLGNFTMRGMMDIDFERDSLGRIIKMYGSGWKKGDSTWNGENPQYIIAVSNFDKHDNYLNKTETWYDTLGIETKSDDYSYEYEYWEY